MKMGIVLTGQNETLEQAVEAIVRAEADGFDTAWRPHIMGLDALMVLAVAGQRTSRIELGSAVVPTYPRHPHSLAQQAATANAATGGRLALGVGRSHQVVIENMFGLRYESGIAHMREYVTVLRTLLDEGFCSFEGKLYRVQAPLESREGKGIPILIGALMPKMLEVCGRLCEGTLTWMCGPRYVASTIVPHLQAASEAVGRPMPRVVVSLPVCVTDDAAAAREFASSQFAIYGQLPVYRSCLDAEGAAGPADIALVGSESEVEAGLRRIASAGASDFYAGIFPDGRQGSDSVQRTQSLLKSLCGKV
ncbi:MAG TPA: TIGR03564 family F420-dependent LLM class oxidoreductase [Candidatus Limnocylindrales bacterium]|nr:TIGR03564 family F420-dependent LLM class oxidoreductase [Candidatus Limnocylindrales bacterium]